MDRVRSRKCYETKLKRCWTGEVQDPFLINKFLVSIECTLQAIDRLDNKTNNQLVTIQYKFVNFLNSLFIHIDLQMPATGKA